jgi:hypothetical protein
MPRRTTALEDFDDDHATAAAWTSGFAGIDGGRAGFGFRFCNGEQFARACDVVGARAFGEQAVVADAMEAFWQHVDQESADELVRAEWNSCSEKPSMMSQSDFLKNAGLWGGSDGCHEALPRSGLVVCWACSVTWR